MKVPELVVKHLEVPATHALSRQHMVRLHACGCASVKLVWSLALLIGQYWHQGCLGWELAEASSTCTNSNIPRTACDGAGNRNAVEQLKHPKAKRRNEGRVLIEFGLQAQASLSADLLIVHKRASVEARSRRCSCIRNPQHICNAICTCTMAWSPRLQDGCSVQQRGCTAYARPRFGRPCWWRS